MQPFEFSLHSSQYFSIFFENKNIQINIELILFNPKYFFVFKTSGGCIHNVGRASKVVVLNNNCSRYFWRIPSQYLAGTNRYNIKSIDIYKTPECYPGYSPPLNFVKNVCAGKTANLYALYSNIGTVSPNSENPNFLVRKSVFNRYYFFGCLLLQIFHFSYFLKIQMSVRKVFLKLSPFYSNSAANLVQFDGKSRGRCQGCQALSAQI